MGLPVYVVNFNEFIAGLKDNININVGKIELDPRNLEAIFDRYFPDIISLLRQIYENTKPLEGTSKKKGYRADIRSLDHGKEFVFEVDSPVLLTGASVSQSKFFQTDFWNLKIVKSDGSEITLFDSIYMKDTLNHKTLNVFFPVPAGYKIKLEYINGSRTEKTFWADLEIVGVSESIFTKGTVIVNHLGVLKNGNITVLDTETHEGLTFGDHVYTPKTFQGYALDDTPTKTANISDSHPTRVIEFMYKPIEIEIPHNYDFKGVLTWVDLWVDLDITVTINHDLERVVNYKNKYAETGLGKLYIDIEEKGKEIFSIEGLAGNNLSIFVQNFNGRELSEDPVFRIIDKAGNTLQDITIPRSLLNMESTRLVYIGDFVPNTGFTLKNIPWNKIG